MSIPFVCPSCQSRMTAPNKAGGRRAKCPKCRATIVIPHLHEIATQPQLRRSGEENKRPCRFEAVFAAFVQAVMEEGHTIKSLNDQGGHFVFTARMSLTCWRMKFSVVILKDGAGDYSAVVHHSYPWPVNWGQGRRLFKKVKERAGKILARQGVIAQDMPTS